jgi:hypothetical protein
MAIPEPALAEIRRFCDRLTPPELRDQMRLEVDTRGNSVTIADWRPPWDGAPGEWTRLPIAQLCYQPTARLWTISWADRNDRWRVYEDLEPTTHLDQLVREIDDDPACIFFG